MRKVIILATVLVATAGNTSALAQESRMSTLASTDLGLRFGVGVAIRAGGRLEVSPELRMNWFFIDRDADPAMLPSFGVRVSLRL